MKSDFKFTFEYIKNQFQSLVDCGYTTCTCAEYVELKKLGVKNKIHVNRVDIDFIPNLKKVDRLVDIFNELNLKATFFLRLHGSEYNPFSFENYRIIKKLISSNHELGYHSEIIDQAAIWDENPEDCLIRDINVINKMFDIKISGVASHGGLTGLNNLDFWKDKKPSDFNLLYEGYDKEPEFNLFQDSFYISDSEWTKWKCYDKGILIKDDRRSLAEHAESGHQIIYSLVHPDTYFDRHFYE